MRRRKRTVSRWMPVLRQRHMAEAFRKLVDDRHHSVAVTNRQRAARAEVILHVDHKEQVVGLDLHVPVVANALIRLNKKTTSIRRPTSEKWKTRPQKRRCIRATPFRKNW